jgi:hypothetical protein
MEKVATQHQVQAITLQVVALEEPYLQLVDRLVLLEQGAAAQEQRTPQLEHRVRPIQAVAVGEVAQTLALTEAQVVQVS